MVIPFDQMPASRRTPGSYVEFNYRLASRGLRADPVRVLMIGQRLSTGTKPELELDFIGSGGQARSYYGRGSHLARMLETAMDANGAMELYGMALNDDAGATAATWTLTFSGAPDGKQTLTLWIAGDRVAISVAADDTASDVAASVNAALSNTLLPDILVTPSVLAAVVTLTLRNKGTLGNALDIHAEWSGTGLAVAVAAGVAGATDPDLSSALDLVVAEDFDFLAVAFADATNLGHLQTHLLTLPTPLVNLGALGVAAITGSYATATSAQSALAACGYIVLANLPGTATFGPEVAAVLAAILASQSDPALPYNNLALPGVMAPWSLSDRLTPTEIETSLWNGVCPLKVGAGEQVRIVRAITTYTENDAAEADDALLDVTTPRTLFWLRDQVRSMLNTKYPRGKNTAGRRSDIRADVLALLFQAEDLEVLENVEANEDGVLVEVNALDPNRCDLAIPADVVNGLHVIAARIDLIL